MPPLQAVQGRGLVMLSLLALFSLVVIGYVRELRSGQGNPDANLWPKNWDSAKEALMVKTLGIGILSTPTYHRNLQQGAMKSWWTESRREMVVITTDTYRLSAENRVPNMIIGDCGSTYTHGLWCKNGLLLKEWQKPQNNEKKWFVRAMDDSYLHLENLYETLTELDHTKVIAIGDLWCYSENVSYPSGGGAMIFSRGFIDSFNWDTWNTPVAKGIPLEDYIDDTLWGEYLANMSITLQNHYGVIQSPLLPLTPLMQYYMSFKDQPWELPFRPMSIHQHQRVHTMPWLHEQLHSINYVTGDSVIELPRCSCDTDLHAKCFWNTELLHAHQCRYGTYHPKCLGPGPWPFSFTYQYDDWFHDLDFWA